MDGDRVEDLDERLDVAGQTWHWVDPVAGAARAAQALRPEGLLCVFWNVEQPPAGLADAFVEVYRRAAPDSIHALRWSTRSPDPYASLRERAVDGLRRSGRFDEPRERQVAWRRTYTRDTWLDQLPTHGGHTQLGDRTTAAIHSGIGAAIDSFGGAFTMDCSTTSVAAHRLS